ncbi:MAG: hypothetical protein ABW000_09135 [Actinoplanes sp.]
MTRRLIPALLAAAVLALSACGGDGGGSKVATLDDGTATTAPSAAASGDLEKKLNDYLECLRKQGADVPDATVDENGQVSFGQPPAGFDRDAFTKAQKVCGDLPDGLTTAFDNMDQSQVQDTALKFAQCMRAEGVDVPDPDMSKLGKGNPFGELDRDDPKTAAAIEVCQKVWADSGLAPRGGGN